MDIVQKGNEILRKRAREVTSEEFGSEKIKNILEQMAQTLSESKEGVALAAPQIGESLRIFIIAKEIFSEKDAREYAERAEVSPNTPPERKPPVVFINPVITKSSQKKKEKEEGCLSVKGAYGMVKRAEKLTVEAMDEHGKKFSRGASGLVAQIIQHETDHLDGTLFIDKAKNLQNHGS